MRRPAGRGVYGKRAPSSAIVSVWSGYHSTSDDQAPSSGAGSFWYLSILLNRLNLRPPQSRGLEVDAPRDYVLMTKPRREAQMITENLGGVSIFTEALAKTLVEKGVIAKSELIQQLEIARDGKASKIPTEHGSAAAEIDKMITRVNHF